MPTNSVERNFNEKLKSTWHSPCRLFMLAPSNVFASSHREAPITALDRSADVTDWYAFVSYDNPHNVIFILNVDPLLEPANGPNYFPFDPSVLYQMHVDNNQDGLDDVTFQFRFTTHILQPNLFTGFVGGIAGIPPITSLSGAGSEGLSLSQTYTVTMVKNGQSTILMAADKRLRSSVERGSGDDAELPIAVHPGNLQPGQMESRCGLERRTIHSSSTWAPHLTL